MITNRFTGLFGLAYLLIGVCLFARTASAEEPVVMRAQEMAAASAAMTHFRRLNPAVDLKHYEIELTRHRNELQIAFIADEPQSNPRSHARTGGGSIYGPDMTYVISIPQLKIIRYSFQR
jgi:hypothetical protein